MNKELKAAIQNLFNQLKFVAENLSDEQFARPSVSLSGSSIGQHFRHTLEFFKCLLSDENGLVNYDNRAHDKSLENSTLETLSLISLQNEAIQKLDSNKNFTLELSYGLEKSNPIRVETNMERELIYNVEHAVHHMALIKIGLREVASNIVLPKGFGVADSTIQYQKVQNI